MKRIDAKNIVKTFCWIAQAGEDGGVVLEPILNKDKGIYECIINLPLIEKTVIGIGDHKIDAIDNATQQTAKLIDKNLKDNPEIELRNLFGGSDYVLEEDDKGSIGIYLKKPNKKSFIN